ncbi:MAG: DUF1353 domain-containing protein [Hyphomicrobium sp.]
MKFSERSARAVSQGEAKAIQAFTGVGIRMAETTPRLQLFQGDGTNFMLADPMPYHVEGTEKRIVVPKGFVTDFASVPRLARAVISVLGRHSIPSLVHDYLYWVQPCTRSKADLIFKNAMTAYGSSAWERGLVYWMVRLLGWRFWRANRRERAQGLIKILPEEYQRIPLNEDWEAYRRALFEAGVTEPPTEVERAALEIASR